MTTPTWIDFLMSESGLEGVGTGRTWTHKEIQERVNDGIGVDSTMVRSSSKRRSEMVFTEEQLRNMDEEDFYIYFTDDPVIDDDKPKSSFKEASKRMKAIEEKSKDIVSKMSAVTQGLTYENYLKSTTPKSSFKEANKRMKAIEDASD